MNNLLSLNVWLNVASVDGPQSPPLQLLKQVARTDGSERGDEIDRNGTKSRQKSEMTEKYSLQMALNYRMQSSSRC